MRPEPAEVSACVWVDEKLVRAIVSAVDGEDKSFHIPADLPQSVRYLYARFLISCVRCKNISISIWITADCSELILQTPVVCK